MAPPSPSLSPCARPVAPAGAPSAAPRPGQAPSSPARPHPTAPGLAAAGMRMFTWQEGGLQAAKSLRADPHEASATTLQPPHATTTLLQERM